MLRFVVLMVTLVALPGCLLVRIRPLGSDSEVKRSDLPKLKRLDGDRVLSLAGPDAIPAIDDPLFVPAAEADFMRDDETVIGVVHDGQAKAYSLWHLDRHEIVNDRLGRDPVAVTW
jgi:hypothetical protein